MVDDTLYLHLHKLSAIKSEEAVDHLLSALWNTRKTGLSSSEKSHFQSLLNLPSLSQLDPDTSIHIGRNFLTTAIGVSSPGENPFQLECRKYSSLFFPTMKAEKARVVLACLRSLIRKCAYQNFTDDDLLKLFPPDLPLDLQSILVSSFQKNKEEWKEGMSSEQVRTNVSPSLTSFPSSEMPSFQWPRQDDPLARLNHNDFGIPMPPDINGSGLNACFQPDIASSDNSENLPRLKSMTWTMEDHGTSPGDKVAVISLKLHDHSKSPFGETEVKFKLSRDTLEAMLRSLTYISEQLSSVEGTSSRSANKKQKQ